MGREEKSQNLIKGEALIRVSRVEKFPEINKRAYPFIRHLRGMGSLFSLELISDLSSFFKFSCYYLSHNELLSQSIHSLGKLSFLGVNGTKL